MKILTDLKEQWRLAKDQIIAWSILGATIIIGLGTFISLFFGLGWLWNSSVCTLYLGAVFVWYNAMCGYMDPNYRTNKTQDTIGTLGMWMAGIALVILLLHIIVWIFG